MARFYLLAQVQKKKVNKTLKRSSSTTNSGRFMRPFFICNIFENYKKTLLIFL